MASENGCGLCKIKVDNIGVKKGGEVLLSGVSFHLHCGELTALIGVNGAGKTSLFRIIAGVSEADSGAVYVQKGHTVGMLEQNPNLTALPGEVTCLEYMYTAFPDLLEHLLYKSLHLCFGLAFIARGYYTANIVYSAYKWYGEFE